MKKILVLLIIILTYTPLFSNSKVVKSSSLAELEKYNIINVEDQNYLSQLNVEKDSNELLVLDRAISDENYPITVGDVYTLTYSVNSKPIVHNILILHSPVISIPSIGEFEVENKTFISLKKEVEKAINSYHPYSYPNLAISKVGVFYVPVRGEVLSNQNIAATSFTTLSELAIYANNAASTRNVTIISKEGLKEDFDLYLALNGDAEDPTLSPGDEVIFNKANNRVTILGSVESSGTYQLNDLCLDNLIENYADGLLLSADRDNIKVMRYVNGEYTELITSYKKGFKLLDEDKVYITPFSQIKGSVLIEGALSSVQDDASTQGSSSSSYYYQFASGDTLFDLVTEMSSLFTTSSDLSNCYLTKDGNSKVVNFQDVLSGKIDYELEDGDKITIPFSQAIVNVSGAVNKPGTFGFVPNKTADYYIARAGGLSSSAKGLEHYEVRDKDGNRLNKDTIITAENYIEVNRDNFNSNLTTTVAIVGLVTSVLGIVTTILSATGVI